MMDVRELITSLLDYDMDATVEIRICSNENNDSTPDFEFVEESYSNHKYLNLEVQPKDQVLVDKNAYEELKRENIDYENMVGALNSNVDYLQQQIYELEEQK